MRAGGFEAEEEEDYERAVYHAPPVGAAPANAAQVRAAALANAGRPFVAAQRLASKKRTEIIVGANGDQWLKHNLSRNRTKQYWRCRNHSSVQSCPVRGWSQLGSTVIHRTDPGVQHTCDNSPAAQAARIVQDAVRAKAIVERDSSNAAVVDGLVRGVPDNVAQLIRRDNLMRVANRAKREHGASALNGPVSQIEFTEAASTTAAGEEFLLYDSRRTEPDLPPIFIFASATGLQELRNARDWGSDGTFSVAPPQFDSLYTVHAMRDDHSAVCAAYMILPDRTGATYIRAIRALIREGNLEDAAPTTVMADFEVGPISAWRAVFPGVRIRGCLFHYTQALWRNIASKGLTLLYRGNNKAKVLLRCFGAMAFVHPNDVTEAFDAIVAALRACIANGEIDAAFDDAITNFCDYVRDNYVRRLDRQGRWQAPRVADAAQWNCHFATLQGFHRTNNSIEAWNRQFAQLFTRAHCAMDKFIYRMQTDEDRSRQALRRQEIHPNEPLRRGRRPQHVATDAALRELAERYDEFRRGGRLLDYMRTAQYHLSKAKFPDEAPADEDPAVPGNNHAAEPAPALPDLEPAPQAVPQLRAHQGRAQAAAAPRGRAQAAAAPGGRAQAAAAPRRVAPAQAAAAPRDRAQDAAAPLRVAPAHAAAAPRGLAQDAAAPRRVAPAHAAAAPRGLAQDAAAPRRVAPAHAAAALRGLAQDAAAPRRVAAAQAGVAELGRALVAAHARAPVPFELPRRIVVEVRRSANNEPVTVQGHVQGVAAVQMPGPSHTATPLRTLASAAALQRRMHNACNQEPGAATAGPSTTRKRPAGAAPLAAPPKNQAMRREAPHEDAQQQEEVQLPSQLSQNAAALQPLIAIDNTSGFVAGRRAGRGSRIADFIRRLS